MSRNKIDCAGNVDPKRLDIDDKPKRRRKPVTRKREPMPEILRPWLEAAYRRKEKRPAQAGIMFEAQGVGPQCTYRPVSPHDDDDGWENMLADSFGTRSWGVICTFLDHLADLCSESFDHTHQSWKPDEREVNAALAIVHASRPKDELDAMLCAQAVAIHWLQMKASASQLSKTHSSYVDLRTAYACSRLARTFVAQVEAIDRRKRKPKIARQVITVKRETHLHKHEHVHLEGGVSENGGQAHAPKGIIDGESIERSREPEERAALPSPDESGRAVPFSSRKRQARLSDARRGKG